MSENASDEQILVAALHDNMTRLAARIEQFLNSTESLICSNPSQYANSLNRLQDYASLLRRQVHAAKAASYKITHPTETSSVYVD